MAVRRWHGLFFGLTCCMAPLVAAAEGSGGALMRDVRQFGQARLQQLHEILGRDLRVATRDEPDWIRDVSHEDYDPEAQPGGDDLQLVIQKERRDGADLLTLRYPLAERGAVRAYAGAGLNRAVYFAEDPDGPALLRHSKRHRSYGPAAEVGAELRVNGELMVNAELRWAEIDGDAILLRSEDGLVGVDPVTVGVSLGWRFR